MMTRDNGTGNGTTTNVSSSSSSPAGSAPATPRTGTPEMVVEREPSLLVFQSPINPSILQRDAPPFTRSMPSLPTVSTLNNASNNHHQYNKRNNKNNNIGSKSLHSTPSGREPIDPWCDDGSVSRAEPPWLRDKRRDAHNKRQKEQRGTRKVPSPVPAPAPAAPSPSVSMVVKQRKSRHVPGGLFDYRLENSGGLTDSTHLNPFDSSLSDSSFASRAAAGVGIGGSSHHRRQRNPTNPFDRSSSNPFDDTPPATPEADRIAATSTPSNNNNKHNNAKTKNIIAGRVGRTNPFETPSPQRTTIPAVAPAGTTSTNNNSNHGSRNRQRRTNPFETPSPQPPAVVASNVASGTATSSNLPHLNNNSNSTRRKSRTNPFETPSPQPSAVVTPNPASGMATSSAPSLPNNDSNNGNTARRKTRTNPFETPSPQRAVFGPAGSPATTNTSGVLTPRNNSTGSTAEARNISKTPSSTSSRQPSDPFDIESSVAASTTSSSSSSGAQDSLAQILDTTDDGTVYKPKHTTPRTARNAVTNAAIATAVLVSPSENSLTSSSVDDSFSTTPSDVALRAAETLKRSFNSPRSPELRTPESPRSARSRSPTPPSPKVTKEERRQRRQHRRQFVSPPPPSIPETTHAHHAYQARTDSTEKHDTQHHRGRRPFVRRQSHPQTSPAVATPSPVMSKSQREARSTGPVDLDVTFDSTDTGRSTDAIMPQSLKYEQQQQQQQQQATPRSRPDRRSASRQVDLNVEEESAAIEAQLAKGVPLSSPVPSSLSSSTAKSKTSALGVDQSKLLGSKRILERNYPFGESSGEEDGEEEDFILIHEEDEGGGTTKGSNQSLALHDLIDEAQSTDDIAWRNALFLLSVQPGLADNLEPENQMNPLHVACLAPDPAPLWMIRALLYTNPELCTHQDIGGRLPLHLLAATSADADIMQLLVDEYPGSVSHQDSRGFTPVQLLLKNNELDRPLSLRHLRIALGQTARKKRKRPKDGTIAMNNSNHSSSNNNENNNNMMEGEEDDADENDTPKISRALWRKREHLDVSIMDLESFRKHQASVHEVMFPGYPRDVQKSLKKITQWKRRQMNKAQFTADKKKKEMEKKNESTRTDSFHIHAENDPLRRLRTNDFVNPASIGTPTGKLLPLHLLLKRTPNEPASQITSQPPASRLDLVRVLIAAYPQSLIQRDASGKTPILTAMLQSQSLPSDELVEVLLGLRTPGYQADSINSPARVASEETLQLPLHVAAEDFAHNLPLLTTIYECYPKAVLVQDIRGRTPLHLALQNYRSIPVSPNALEVLFVEQVSQIKDHDGQYPLDLVIANPKCLGPSSNHHAAIVAEFLDASFRNNDNYNNGSGGRSNRKNNDGTTRSTFVKLQHLPPWLRRHACAAQYVQSTLVDELSTTWNTFWILLTGVVLVILLILIRVVLNQPPPQDGYISAIYLLASFLLIIQLWQVLQSIAYFEFVRLTVANPWTYIHLTACALSIATSYLISTDPNVQDSIPQDDDSTIATIGAAATGALWLSLVGYLVQWWCSMAITFGLAVRVLTALLWPIGFGGTILCLAMTQVLFTLEQCQTSTSDTNFNGVCTKRDVYTIFYWMILGEPIVFNTGNEMVDDIDATDNGYGDDFYSFSTGTTIVLLLFTCIWIWWILSVLIILLSEAVGGGDPSSSRFNRHEVALSWYWEPKAVMAGNFIFQRIARYRSIQLPQHGTTTSSTRTQRCCHSKEHVWYVLSTSLVGGKNPQYESYRNNNGGSGGDTYWYSSCFKYLLLTRILGIIILPIWFIVGILTLGLLWPPQVRRWLFQPPVSISSSRRRRQQQFHYNYNRNYGNKTMGLSKQEEKNGTLQPPSSTTTQYHHMHVPSPSSSLFLEHQVTMSKLSMMKSQMHRFESQTFQQTQQLQNDIAEIKDLLYRAMMEE